jgi:hypothetical protein
MSVTAKACRKVASQLARASKNASFAGEGTGVVVSDPKYLVGLLRRAAREMEGKQ